MMKNSILLLSKVLVGLMLLAPPAPAAVQFTAVGGQVAAGGNLNVHITVSGFTDIVGFQFTLQWDPSVLQFSSVNNLGLSGLDGDNFGTTLTSSGKLTVSWDNASPQTVNNDATIFAVNYIAVGVSGLQSSVSFVDDPTAREVYLPGPIVGEFGSTPGNVSVVPEPVNIALGVFAGLFAGGTTLRWFLRKRSVRSAASS